MDHRLPGKSSQEAVQFGSIIEQIVLLWDTLPKSSKQLQQAPMHPEKNMQMPWTNMDWQKTKDWSFSWSSPAFSGTNSYGHLWVKTDKIAMGSQTFYKCGVTCYSTCNWYRIWGGSIVMGVPLYRWMVHMEKKQSKIWMILGYPHLWKPPHMYIYIYMYIYMYIYIYVHQLVF